MSRIVRQGERGGDSRKASRRSSRRSTVAHRSCVNFSTIGVEGIELHTVIASDDEPLSERDLAETRQVIEEWYEPMSDVGFKVFASMILRKGWGKRRLQDAVYRFLEHRYPRWTPGDFVGSEPRLYPLEWYRERIRESPENARRIGWYRAEGCEIPLCGWREEVADVLPAWEFPKAVIANETSSHPVEPYGRAMPPDLEIRCRLGLLEIRIKEMERERSRLHDELRHAQRTICDQAVVIAELRAPRTIADGQSEDLQEEDAPMTG